MKQNSQQKRVLAGIPPQAFIAVQKAMKEEIERPTPRGPREQSLQDSRIQEMRGLLRNWFARAFQVSPDNRRKTMRVADQLRRSNKGSSLFDHCEEFRCYNDDILVVTQPYGLNQEMLATFCQEQGVTASVVDAWSYHYPGWTNCVVIRIGPERQKTLLREARSVHA